jgi:hypothetical protein
MESSALEEHHGPLSFSDSVNNVLIESEEFRRRLHILQENASNPNRNVTSKTKVCSPLEVFSIRQDMEDLMAQLYAPGLVPRDDVETEMRRHCQLKAADVAWKALIYLTKHKQEPDPDDPDGESYNTEQETNCQAAIARIAELNLVLLEPEPDSKEKQTRQQEIVQVYSSYQRQVLRQRAKPSIARLVDCRKRQDEHQQVSALTRALHNSNHGHDADDDDDDEDDISKSQHVHVITTILGQASALIHPLMMWKSNLPPEAHVLTELCSQSIHLVDEQAQSLAKTVATWYEP